MLVLHRKPGEKIVIGEGPNAVVFEIVAVNGQKVTLGMTGPKDVRVDRMEVYESRHGGPPPMVMVRGGK